MKIRLVARGAIYAITNITNSKTYIGSAVNVKRRWRNHRSALLRGRHHNPHLQRAWDKYGETAFKFGVLEYLDDPEELHIAEQEWMDGYREKGYELYNCGIVAERPMENRKHTPEARQKMSEARQGKKHPLWSKSLSDETRRKMSAASLGKPKTKEHSRRVGEARARLYPAFFNHGTGEIIPAGRNLAKLCRERGLDGSCMWCVANGKRPRHAGWELLEGATSG